MSKARAASVDEAARRLGVHPNTVRRRIKDGTLAHVRFGGRVLVPLWALERLLGPPATRPEVRRGAA